MPPLPPHEPSRFETTDGYECPDTTNGRRAAAARESIAGLGLSGHAAHVDFISNLLHAAHADGLDPLAVLREAGDHFQAEAGDASDSRPAPAGRPSGMRVKRYSRIVELAQEQSPEDGIEFDGNPAVSEGDDNGAYVSCWAWADFTGTELDKNNH